MGEPRAAISLKWKTLAMLGLALAVVNGGLVLYDYSDRVEAFQSRQQHELDRKMRVMEELLNRSHDRLQRIGILIPNVVDSLPVGAALLQQWATLQLELGLDLMEMVDQSGKVLLKSVSGPGANHPPEVSSRIEAALQSEQPDRFLYCDESCANYALVPTIGNDGSTRMMVLAADMSDMVLQFPGLTDASLALYAKSSQADSWFGYRRAAVSNAPVNEPLLDLVESRWQPAQLSSGVNLTVNGRTLRLTLRHWNDLQGLGDGQLLIFEDITEQIGGIAREVQQGLTTGLAALLVASLLGWLILNRPMNQLRRLADALPLLAEKAYEPARQRIGVEHKHRRLPTEIDLLEGLAVDLADRLEDLERLVEARNQAIAEKVTELRRSTELNEKIFSTAPVAMLMLSSDGLIERVNDFCSILLGFGGSELVGRPFLKLLANKRQSRDAGDALVDLVAGRRGVFEQTGRVLCVNGEQEQMTWLHTRVLAQGGVFILSLGLPDRSAVAIDG